MSLFDHKQYEYFKLTRDYAGKIKGEVFKVALDQSQVQWYDKDGGGHVTLELSSPLLEKLPDLNISEFRYKDSEIFKRVKQTAKYKSGAKTVFTIDEIMENPDFVIHAVKNSIGLEFTVGERTSQGVIQSFQVQRHNEVHAMFNDGKNYADVNTLEKIWMFEACFFDLTFLSIALFIKAMNTLKTRKTTTTPTKSQIILEAVVIDSNNSNIPVIEIRIISLFK